MGEGGVNQLKSSPVVEVALQNPLTAELLKCQDTNSRPSSVAEGVGLSGERAPDIDPKMIEATTERPERVLLGKRPSETVLTEQEEHKKRNKKD